jgi:hypothetical protein
VQRPGALHRLATRYRTYLDIWIVTLSAMIP